MSELSRGRKAALAAFGLIAIGSLGPWISVGGTSAGGLDKDGVLTIIVAAIGAAYVCFISRPHWSVPAMCGFLAGFVAIFDIIDIIDTPAIFGVSASPGWGIWLTAVASIGLLIVAVTFVRRDDPQAPLETVGKVLLGLGVGLIVLFAIGLAADDEDVAGLEQPELTPVEPPDQP